MDIAHAYTRHSQLSASVILMIWRRDFFEHFISEFIKTTQTLVKKQEHNE